MLASPSPQEVPVSIQIFLMAMEKKRDLQLKACHMYVSQIQFGQKPTILSPVHIFVLLAYNLSIFTLIDRRVVVCGFTLPVNLVTVLCIKQAFSYRSHFSATTVTKIWTLTGTSQRLGEDSIGIIITKGFQPCTYTWAKN